MHIADEYCLFPLHCGVLQLLLFVCFNFSQSVFEFVVDMPLVNER